MGKQVIVREWEAKLLESEKEKKAIIEEWRIKTQDLVQEIEQGKRERQQLVQAHAQEKEDWRVRERGLQNEVSQLQQELERLRAEMERVKREAEAKYAKLIQQVEEITGQKVVVEDHLSVEKTATQRLKSEVDRLLATIDALRGLEAENERQRQQIKELEAALRNANIDIENWRAEVEKLRREAADRYAQLRAEIERITGVKIEVEGDLSSERTVTTNLREEIQRLLRTI